MSHQNHLSVLLLLTFTAVSASVDPDETASLWSFRPTLPNVLTALFLGWFFISIAIASPDGPAPAAAYAPAKEGVAAKGGGAEEEEEFDEEPRDFTPLQLRAFDGGEVELYGSMQTQPVYIALKGDVYDVSADRALYGPGGEKSQLAGRDVSRSVATGRSVDEIGDAEEPPFDLSDLSESDLATLEKEIAAFRDKFPLVGRVGGPPLPRTYTREQLRGHDGTGAVPAGRLNPPLLVGVRKTVYDVSFGGWELYKPGATYNVFCGNDASRALAKMSLEKADAASIELSDLTDEQIKVLDDWEKRYKEKYPVVGDVSF